MSGWKRKGIFLPLALMLFTPIASAGVLYHDEVLLRTGQSIEYWGAEWWKRVAVGDLANADGPVFFAEASSGTPLELEYEVAADRFILFPIASFVYFGFDAVCDVDCSIADLNHSIDAFEHPYATIDGNAVSNMGSHIVWGDSPDNFVFDIDAALINEVGAFEAVQGGYWLMLDALNPGLHQVTFGASVSLPDYEATYDTTLWITSVPEPATPLLLGLGVLALALVRRKLLGNVSESLATRSCSSSLS